MLDIDKCWETMEKRDAAEDGRFVYGLRTTGIYSRPSCPARLPLRKNVRFYRTPADAERDGLRACLRCRPHLPRPVVPLTHRILEVCRYMEANSNDSLSLKTLAARAGISLFHFHRRFRAELGLTPKQYLDWIRLRKLKQILKESFGVTDAVYEAGYSSSSRVYGRAPRQLGMTPSQYRYGGKDATIFHFTIATPAGMMMIGATRRGVCFFHFGHNSSGLLALLVREYPRAMLVSVKKPYPADLQKQINCLKAYLGSVQPSLDLPLEIRLTALQILLWNRLQSISFSVGAARDNSGGSRLLRRCAQSALPCGAQDRHSVMIREQL